MTLTTINNQLIKKDAINEIIKDFLNNIDVSFNSLKAYKKNLNVFIDYIFNNNIEEITRQNLIEYKKNLEEQGLKATTIKSYIQTLKKFYSYLNNEYGIKNIALNIKCETPTKDFKKDYLRIDQIKKVLSSFDLTTNQGLRDYAIMRLLLTTGLRTIELERANIEDLKSIGNTPVLFIQGKGRKDKTDYVKIPVKVYDAINSYLQTRNDATDIKTPLFESLSSNHKNERLTKDSISRIVKQTFIKCGYNSPLLTAHSTRHTCITQILLNGGSLEQAQQIARHKDITTTMIYNHAIDRDKNNCEQMIDDLF